MLNWNLGMRILFGKPAHPPIKNLRFSRSDDLYLDSLTRSLFVAGRPGSGKTVWAAMQLVRYAREHPEHAIFALDLSGSLTEEVIALIFQLPEGEREMIARRLVLDIPGYPGLTTGMPFFSPAYGLGMDEQVERVRSIYMNLNEEMMQRTPVMAIAITELLPELSKLLLAMKNERGNAWQLTEAKKLLIHTDWLRQALNQFGGQAKGAKFYFEDEYLSEDLSRHERNLRSFTLRSVLGNLESDVARARFGSDTPGWTAREAIAEGFIVLVSGAEITNQEQTQAIVFADVFSHILAQINKRRPHDPADRPVLLVIDEVPMLLEIKGMAKEIAKVSPRYRSRKLELAVIVQMLAQLDEDLRQKIWSLGNTVIFGLDSFNEALEVAQQHFEYDPTQVKLQRDNGNPLMETDRGAYLQQANWIQHLRHRECIMKLYVDEGHEEDFVRYIERTNDKPNRAISVDKSAVIERLLRRRAVPIREALQAVNSRRINDLQRRNGEEKDTTERRWDRPPTVD